MNSRLRLQPLELRDVPATAVYTAATQTLTVTAAQGDIVSVEEIANKPAGYLRVETQGDVAVFDSDTENRAIRNLVVRHAGVDSGGFVLTQDTLIPGSLTIVGARQSHTADLLGRVGGNVIYRSATGFAAIEQLDLENTAVIGGSLTVSLGGGENTVRLIGGRVGGDLSITGGAGQDEVFVNFSDDVDVGGSMSVALGNGINNVTSVGIRQIRVGGDFTYTGGNGDDNFNLDGGGSALIVGGHASFTVGSIAADANAVRLENLTARSASILGGAGNDTVEVSGALVTNGNVVLTLGNGDNTFDANLQGMGTNSVGGSLRYTGGTGDDVVNLDRTTVLRNLNVNVADNGAVQVGLKSPAGVTVFGLAKMTGGLGAESFLIRRSYFGNSLNVTALAGADTLTIDDTDVAGRTAISLGGGADVLEMELLTSDGGGTLDGVTSFGGPVEIRFGEGADTFDMSADDDAQTLIRFGGRLTLIGGSGTDALNTSSDNVFEVTGVVSDLETVTGPSLP